ncbi:hypothetical protein C8J56DRAFT_799956, partial [Mycena floridula]
FPRSSSTIIVRLRAGNAPLNDWLFKIGSAEVESNLCETCWKKEDVNHFFFFCRRFSAQRSRLKAKMSRNANSIHHLLGTPEGIRHALLFIKETN